MRWVLRWTGGISFPRGRVPPHSSMLHRGLGDLDLGILASAFMMFMMEAELVVVEVPIVPGAFLHVPLFPFSHTYIHVDTSCIHVDKYMHKKFV